MAKVARVRLVDVPFALRQGFEGDIPNYSRLYRDIIDGVLPCERAETGRITVQSVADVAAHYGLKRKIILKSVGG